MKKVSVIFALLVSIMVVGRYAAADVEDGQFHFTPKIGYFDPRASNADGSFAWGGVVSYQWDYRHEVGLGVLSSSHDIDDAAAASDSDVNSLVWNIGYKYHFDSTRRSQQGHWTVGLDLAPHRLKYGGEKWNKMGVNLNVGYEWKSKWVAELGYLFAGTDDLGMAGSDDDVRMGGLGVLVGYKF